jgi:hypothetical protein
MEKNSFRIWVWVIVAVVVVAAIILYFVLANNQIIGPVATEPASTQDIGTQDIGAGSVSIAYADALVKYADRRIQLNKACNAQPTNVTYKDNTGIMIDNRSPQARTITVGTTFTIKPWGFKIVVLPDVYLAAKTIFVDCGQLKNVATILVQE